jgi:hypothetical protein
MSFNSDRQVKYLGNKKSSYFFFKTYKIIKSKYAETPALCICETFFLTLIDGRKIRK